MQYYLYRIETYGMKNIQNLITIDFCAQTIDNKSKKKNSFVKAIYGTNGAGKSSIIHSVSLFKKIMMDSSLLKQKNVITQLNKLINKIKKEFYISIIYGIRFFKNDEYKIYKTEIKIKIDNNIPYIEFERFSVLKDQTINGNFESIYEVNNGILLINSNEKSELNDFFKNKTLNILTYSSCTSLLVEKEVFNEIENLISKGTNESIKNLGIVYYMLINRYFAIELSIHLDAMDLHNEYDNDSIEKLLAKLNINNELFIKYTIGSKKDIIEKKSINEYEKNIKRLCEFLKLFKPDLQYIKIDTSEDENYFYCSKKMIYNDFEVDSDYESTGIQKLMSIFNSIEDVTKGKIVFIDELDANINGVYLKVLIEYLNYLNKGQLCFTTHNLYPMKYLYKYTNSIDFIGETGKLIPWKKNGNYKPYNQYPEGMIVDSPFNIDLIDFIKVFEQNGDK